MVLPFLAALAPFAPLIGGAIGAAGSLFAPKPKAQQMSVDYVAMRKAAEKAGFNPLTVLRNGGSAGFSTIPAGPDNRVSNALMTFGSAVSQFTYDPLATRRGQTELALAEAQLANFAKDGASGNRSIGGIPTVTDGGTRSQASAGATIPIAGMPVKYNPGWADSNEITNRYGEPAEWVYSPLVVAADLYHNFMTSPTAGELGMKGGGGWDMITNFWGGNSDRAR